MGIGNLRVVVMPDGDQWFAQGLEIDYASQGEDSVQAMSFFRQGLESTVKLHIGLNGNITSLLRIAPKDEWLQMYTNILDDSSQCEPIIDSTPISETPFDGILYLVFNEGKLIPE